MEPECFLCTTARQGIFDRKSNSPKRAARKRGAGANSTRDRRRSVLKDGRGKNGATYWADQGKFAVSAGERSVMEQFSAASMVKSSAVASLAQSSAYQRRKPILGSGVLEFLLASPI